MEGPVLAEEVLAEIESETLQEFLCNIRHSGALSPTEVPQTALDLCLATVNNATPLKPGDVVEIQGPPASGKTYLVYQYIMVCVLPRRHNDIPMGGWGKAAIVVDTDGTFNISRLHLLLRARIAKSFGASLAHEEGLVGDLALRCLRKVHIFRPASSTQLAASILNLSHYHTTSPHMQDEEIALLVVDSMSSFYWNDRFTTEQLRSGPSGHNAKNPLHHVVVALNKFRRTYSPLILLTNWALNRLDKGASDTGQSASPFYKQHLHPYPNPFQHLGTDATAPFPAHESGSSSREPSSNRAVRPDSQRASTLPLTYHVTLRPAPLPLRSSELPPTGIEGTADELRDNVELGQIEGFVRIPGTEKVERFLFRIRENEVCSAA